MSIHRSAESGIEVAPFIGDVTTTQRVAPDESRTGALEVLPNPNFLAPNHASC